MKHSTIAVFFLIHIFGLSLYAQSVLESLIPQPRQAYIRTNIPPNFSFQNNTFIYLDENSPDYKHAYEFNREMNKRGLDTLTIRMGSIQDTLLTNIVIGKNFGFINNTLKLVPDQQVELSADYPGKEGYILDIMTVSVIIGGSDDFGLHYGIVTFFQLYDLLVSPKIFPACRIIDAPEFPNRWYYYPTNFLVGANNTKAKAMVDTAAKYKFNGVLSTDYKFGFVTNFLPGNFGDSRYTDSVVSYRKYAVENYNKIVLGTFSFGYSNDILANNPNWASGLPVKDQKFVIKGDSARLIPQSDVTLPNPGFEQYNGNTFSGYNMIDGAGTYSFVDTKEKHSGNASIRFENADSANARMTKRFAVKQFTEFHAVAWIKTENASIGWGPHINIYDKNVINSINFTTFTTPATTNGWQKYEVTFNSLNNDTIFIYWGAWSLNSGKIWFDDLLVEEVPFVNLIRRAGAPLTVSNTKHDITYTEGTDFENLKDPLMGMVPYSGSYNAYHQPPKFKIISNGKLKNGDTILVSYCHAIIIYEDQVMVTMSDPDVYTNIEKQLRIVDSLMKPDIYFMSHDEIRTMNWDDGDQKRNMKPAEILADNTNKCYDIIKKVNPIAEIYDWSDMFDIFHNAVEKDYYLVNGDMRGSADLINKNIKISNWNSTYYDSSLAYFSSRGFSQMTAPFYDQDENNIRIWKQRTKNTPDFLGMMYTTWSSNYRYMMHFSQYAWNHAPYIYHNPPMAFSNNLQLPLKIIGDKWDSLWQIRSVKLYYKTPVDNSFISVPLTITTGKDTVIALVLSANAKAVKYYFEAIDNHGWVTKVPFIDSVFFKLGDWTTSVADSKPGLSSIIITPNPASDYIEIVGAGSEPAQTGIIRIYNTLGEKVLAIGIQNFEPLRIDISALLPGLYFVRIGDKLSMFIKY